MTRIKPKPIDRKIKMFEGRPDREETINEEDIINLKIALNQKSPKIHNALDYFLYNT